MEWNVDPVFFSLGAFEVRYYSLLFVVAFLGGYHIMKYIIRREGLAIETLDKLFVYVAVGTIIGARLGHCIFYDWAYYSKNIAEIFLPFHNGKFIGYAGLASHGAAIGIMIFMYIFDKKYTKKGLVWVLDRLVIPTMFGGFCIRCGNLMNSEIVGAVTDVPWAFHFARVDGESMVMRHPAQLYEAFCYLLIFAFLMFMYWKRDAGKRKGLILGTFFLLVFLARFIIEFVKEVQEPWEQGMIINMGQILSIPFILVGIWLIWNSFRSASAVKK